MPVSPGVDLTQTIIFMLTWMFSALFDTCDTLWQHQDREGEEGACKAARDDQDGDQRGRNR